MAGLAYLKIDNEATGCSDTILDSEDISSANSLS